MCAHVNHAFQTKFRTDSRRGHAVLARPCFRDDTGFAHTTRQNDLAQHVVDFMRARVIQLVPLHIDFRTTQMIG